MEKLEETLNTVSWRNKKCRRLTLSTRHSHNQCNLHCTWNYEVNVEFWGWMISLYFNDRIYCICLHICCILCLDMYLRMRKIWVASCVFWFNLGRRSSLQYQESSRVVSSWCIVVRTFKIETCWFWFIQFWQQILCKQVLNSFIKICGTVQL